MFFATGNNLAIQGDLTRRALLISLDADCERPEKRQFDFEPINVARKLHPELAVAGLTALRAYVLAGKPWTAQRPALGSFEVWDRLVCGCLLWCGYSDPVGTRDQVIESDPQREADLELLAAWYDMYGDTPKRLSEIAALGQTSQVYTLLAADSGGWDLRKVGRRLARLKGRVIGGYKLGTGSRGHKTGRTWWVKQRGVASVADRSQ